MNNTMRYKGYTGSVEFSETDGVFYGKVQGVRSLISYEGKNAKKLMKDFKGAVDDYLALCKEENIVPETPSEDYDSIEIPAGICEDAAAFASKRHMTLGDFTKEALLGAMNASATRP